jgi:hypothetical protein
MSRLGVSSDRHFVTVESADNCGEGQGLYSTYCTHATCGWLVYHVSQTVALEEQDVHETAAALEWAAAV